MKVSPGVHVYRVLLCVKGARWGANDDSFVGSGAIMIDLVGSVSFGSGFFVAVHAL